jgi:hypothetical protein
MMMIFKERERESVVVVVNASLQRSPPSRSYEIVVVLKVARFCARACVLCISTDESRNL